MKIHIPILLLLLTCVVSRGQNKTALHYASCLDSARMKSVLTQLASVEFAGRKSNGDGAKLSANYLSEKLKENGLKEGNHGSYKQNLQAFHKEKSDKYFRLDDFNYADCYSYNNYAFQDSVVACSDIVFAGYGLYHPTFNDFANVDVTNKIVLVMTGSDGPVNKFGVKCHSASEIPNLKYIASQNPKAILTIRPGFSSFSNYASDQLNFYSPRETSTIPTIQINELLANRILEPVHKSVKQLLYESENNCTSNTFEFKNELLLNGDFSYKLADVNNIVAVIEGSDLKDEYIVAMAHYDHIGTDYYGKVNCGADDNASGVSAILEIARVFNEAKKAGKGPRRSIVVLFPTAEEDGLYGSEYYIQKPIYPLEKTIACLNIDMIGRIGSKEEKEDLKNGYVYTLTESSKVNNSLFGIADSINTTATQLTLISNEGSSYSGYFSRSDHYSFYKKKIPSIMFTNGSHDDLHKTTDVAEKINYSAMLQRSRLAFLTLWELANNPKPFKPEKEEVETFSIGN